MSTLFSYLEAEAWWGSTAATALTGTNTDNVGVDGAGDAVVDLDVELGEGVLYSSTIEKE